MDWKRSEVDNVSLFVHRNLSMHTIYFFVPLLHFAAREGFFAVQPGEVANAVRVKKWVNKIERLRKNSFQRV